MPVEKIRRSAADNHCSGVRVFGWNHAHLLPEPAPLASVEPSSRDDPRFSSRRPRSRAAATAAPGGGDIARCLVPPRLEAEKRAGQNGPITEPEGRPATISSYRLAPMRNGSPKNHMAPLRRARLKITWHQTSGTNKKLPGTSVPKRSSELPGTDGRFSRLSPSRQWLGAVTVTRRL